MNDICDEIEKMVAREALFDIVLLDDHRKWQAIRNIYETIGTDRYTPYPVDWTKIFTPIERMAWGEIRDRGLPFYPQFPIGRFFVDLADPVRKIVIECDGKAFHSAIKDAARDEVLNSLGWRVFRVSGADCNRVLPDPWEDVACAEDDVEQAQALQSLSTWAKSTVDGLVWSISIIYYKESCAERYAYIAGDVVAMRMSRPGIRGGLNA